MDMEITYNDIISRCEQLSSFEARGKVDANGESRYLDIHINSVDEQLILQYIKQAIALMEEGFSRMIDKSEETTRSTTVTVSPKVVDFSMIIDMLTGELDSSIEDSSPIGFVRKIFQDSKASLIYKFAKYKEYDDKILISIHNIPDIYYDSTVFFRYTPTSTYYKWKDDMSDIEETSLPQSTTTTTTITGFKWTLRTDTRWNGINAFTKHITEAIVSYTMAHWLSGRLDERVAFYENLFTTSLAMATKNLFTKQPPQK